MYFIIVCFCCFNDAAKADYFSYNGVNTHLVGGLFGFFYASGSGDLEITVWNFSKVPLPTTLNGQFQI